MDTVKPHTYQNTNNEKKMNDNQINKYKLILI